jgi:DNA-binding transcriptional regulator YdaS (Cro superfamily)
MSPADILRTLITADYGGSQAQFARAIGRSPSQVNQWLTGHRKLDIKGSRHIEEKLRLPVGYFQGAQATANKVAETLPPPYIHENETTRKIIALLDATDEAGRGIALHVVRQALKEYAADQVNAA